MALCSPAEENEMHDDRDDGCLDHEHSDGCLDHEHSDGRLDHEHSDGCYGGSSGFGGVPGRSGVSGYSGFSGFSGYSSLPLADSERDARIVVFLAAFVIVVVILFSYSLGYTSAEGKYKKELGWWMNEPTVQVLDMSYTQTADLDVWKTNHPGVKVIKLVELPQKRHYGVYWLPAEKENR